MNPSSIFFQKSYVEFLFYSNEGKLCLEHTFFQFLLTYNWFLYLQGDRNICMLCLYFIPPWKQCNIRNLWLKPQNKSQYNIFIVDGSLLLKKLAKK